MYSPLLHETKGLETLTKTFLAEKRMIHNCSMGLKQSLMAEAIVQVQRTRFYRGHDVLAPMVDVSIVIWDMFEEFVPDFFG